MNTKLVYVLTCAPEAYYIEQALMAVFSARHHNPDAHIVLIVDDKTDALLVDKRAEILKFISEKIVIPFEDSSLNPMYRSRWIKTSVRQLIQGDFLFVDCDTICQHSLNHIDRFNCNVGAVLESHLNVQDFCTSLYDSANRATSAIGLDINKQNEYFSSGVLYVKDTPDTHRLYELWHQYWIESNSIGISIDQPSLAKANRDVEHIIRRLPDTYNCILFTRPPFTRQAHILHITAYQNPSYLFTKRVLAFVKENGLNNQWLRQSVLMPCQTFLPFDYDMLHSSFTQRRIWCKEIAESARGYCKYIDPSFKDLPMNSTFKNTVVRCFTHHMYRLGATLWIIWCRLRLINKKKNI